MPILLFSVGVMIKTILLDMKKDIRTTDPNSWMVCDLWELPHGSEKIANGYGVRTARVAKAAKELDRFLIENGYKKGNVKPLAAYSEQKPVTDAEKALFDAACSSYQFPLGTPQTAGKRETPDGTDYKISVKSRGMNGEEATSTIYVTVEKGGKPEFTEVVR